jgi:hypothetical protein
MVKRTKISQFMGSGNEEREHKQDLRLLHFYDDAKERGGLVCFASSFISSGPLAPLLYFN